VLADDPVMGVLRPGDHGSTFGGNPLAAAVGREALRVLFDEGMIENAATLGAYFLGWLRAIRSPRVREVRGRGLWAGVEVAEETGGARRFVDALLSRGVLCKDTHGRTLRFAPPLTISREDLDWGLERVEAALTEDA
jgi:ornithine--oxo-acid transaminase